MAAPDLVVAPLTPFTSELKVDEKVLERQINPAPNPGRPAGAPHSGI